MNAKPGRRAFIGGLVVAMAGGAATAKPNVIVIVADDLGYAGLGCYGSPDARTPHIDSLARGGVRFTDGYVTAALCSPSRAGLLTGRYQQRFGYEFNTGSPQREMTEGLGLPVSETTLADAMKKAGYSTGAVGKWHMGMQPQFHPNRRGFDEFFGFRAALHSYVETPGEGLKIGPYTSSDTFRQMAAIDRANPIMRDQAAVREPEYLTDAFTREALAFVDRHRSEPFFLYLAYNAPHVPLQVPSKYYDRFPHSKDENARVYAAMVSALDDGVGALIEKLEKTGLAANTLIVFVSDNGCPVYTNAAGNGPLKNGKATYFEGGIRVPLLMKWPGRIPAGTVNRQPAISLDIFPTVLAAAGAEPSGVLDGVNLLPFLKGEKNGVPHDTLYWRSGSQRAIRQGNWKLFTAGKDVTRLYDLSEDMGEKSDFSKRRPDIVAKLDGAARRWEAGLAKPLWPSWRSAPATDDGQAFQVDH